MHIRTFASCLASMLVGAPIAPAVAQTTNLPPEVDAHIRRYVENGSGVGIALALVTAEGTRFYGFGTTGGATPHLIDERSVFEIGSITKTFTGLALADLQTRRVVQLDDPVSKYLPDDVHVPSRNGRQITLMNLATQTSGLPRLPSNLAPADPSNPYADYTERDLYAFLSSYTLPRDPGEESEYSNLGFGLLGHALARANGTTYEQLIVDRIAQPLRMPDTRITISASLGERLAYGHSGGAQVPHWDFAVHAGAGGLVSTASDMARYMAAVMGLEATPLDAAMRVATEQRSPNVAGGMGIALAWVVGEIDDGSHVIWHNGGTGGYRSFAGVNVTRGLGVVVLSNTDESVDPIGFRLLDGTTPLPEIRTAIDLPPDVLDRYVGEYRLTAAFSLTVRRRESGLTIQGTGQGEIPVLPSSETEFFATVIDARVTFERNDSGEITALVLYQGGAEQRALRIQ